jgi:hypothetical protein
MYFYCTVEYIFQIPKDKKYSKSWLSFMAAGYLCAQFFYVIMLKTTLCNDSDENPEVIGVTLWQSSTYANALS